MKTHNEITAEKIKEILKRSSDSHNVFTPFELCDEMLDKIPKLNKEQSILVMFNLEFVHAIRERFGKEGINNLWFLTPDEFKKKAAIIMGVNENHIVVYEYNTKKVIGIENMPKFDVVVGNPPYLKNMHLKMLKIAVDSLNENGKIVWLQPARWLQDLIAPYKKNSDFNKYKNLPFINFKIIPNKIAIDLFNIEIQSDLIISELENGKETIISEDFIYKLREVPITFKRLLTSEFKSMKEKIEENKREGIRVKINFITPFEAFGKYLIGKYDIISRKHKFPFIDGMKNELDWTLFGNKNQFTKEKGSNIPLSIKFNTVEEAQNFIDSTFTEVFQFFNYLSKLDVHVQFRCLPFMDDYKEPWTNERFKEYFKISDEEMIFIKETMKTYL